MKAILAKTTIVFAALALAIPQSAMAQDIDFGDDEGDWANDGECDDKRFSGEGMTSTPLLDSDIGHDASDCRSAYEAGKLVYDPDASSTETSPAPSDRQPSDKIAWGDDSSDWAKDGECDDMRFTGPGMTETPLMDEDVKRDASDCRIAYEQGRIELKVAGD